ncbi:Golgin subfamily A member 7 [Merluccius polli]|uniref:Golgin subfamily A member 7 n=1 Tax=Merluccius polli TaxID=89951 RepID=A0AA47NNT7_MERPO|nr:Golgin subfamily A member 7 [Merluccius polli]
MSRVTHVVSVRSDRQDRGSSTGRPIPRADWPSGLAAAHPDRDRHWSGTELVRDRIGRGQDWSWTGLVRDRIGQGQDWSGDRSGQGQDCTGTGLVRGQEWSGTGVVRDRIGQEQDWDRIGQGQDWSETGLVRDRTGTGVVRNRTGQDWSGTGVVRDRIGQGQEWLTHSLQDLRQAAVAAKVFIQRDYTNGTVCQFQTKFPSELETRIDKQQFEETVRTLNNLYAEAEKLGGQSYLEGCLACLTAYTVFLCMETHYEKVLKKIAKYIQEQNDKIYAPRGLLLTDPIERGLRVVSFPHALGCCSYFTLSSCLQGNPL